MATDTITQSEARRRIAEVFTNDESAVIGFHNGKIVACDECCGGIARVEGRWAHERRGDDQDHEARPIVRADGIMLRVDGARWSAERRNFAGRFESLAHGFSAAEALTRALSRDDVATVEG
jgi:hypothetical protein